MLGRAAEALPGALLPASLVILTLAALLTAAAGWGASRSQGDAGSLEVPTIQPASSDAFPTRRVARLARSLLAIVPLALLVFADGQQWNRHVPGWLPFLRFQCLLPLVLAGMLWNFRVVHWIGGRLALWLYQQRYGLIFERRPRRLILLRHGESVGNLDKHVYESTPDNRLSLSARGQEQANHAADQIKALIGTAPVGVFVSPFLRTQQTCARVLSKLDPAQVLWVRQDPRLREQEWGNFQLTRDSLKILEEREKVGRFYYRFPTGESGADVYDRVSSFFVSLFRQFDGPVKPPENILIVSHGLMMRFFCMRYFRWSVDTFDTVWNPDNCDLWVLGKDDRGRYSFTTEGTIPRSTKAVTVVFHGGRVETLLLKDYITAPVTARRRQDWILAQLGLDPSTVREVILDRRTELESEALDDDDYPIRKLLDAEEKLDMILI